MEEKIEKLSQKEKLILDKAVEVIYFNDKSDYLSALYFIVRKLLDIPFGDDIPIDELFKILNKSNEI